jgi:asparagine synthase (glutamine-hydrolysing)
MCGIVGIASTAGPVDLEALGRGSASLNHRGPDDAGVYASADERVALGFRRLSIIDVSAAGHQPMPNEDGTLQLVFNGEIYNFRQLREQLEQQGHRFRSRTDSEAILHLYEEHGIAAIDQLVGMFALAIWDESRRRLVLVRDRLGIKPLYYAWDGQKLCFASELRALLDSGWVPRVVDHDALADYLTYGYVPFDRALVAGVQKLPAGHLLVFDLDTAQVEVSQYWDVEYEPTVSDPEAAVAELSELLDGVVGDHLISDVPLGLFLSGGVDSTAVLAKMRRAADSVEAFAIGFDTGHGGELPYARRAAELLGASFHERVVTLDHGSAFLSNLANLYDEPLVDYSTIPTYEVSRFARERITVAITGDGGDEVFGGYGRYAAHVAAAGQGRRSYLAPILQLALPVLRRVPLGTRAAALERELFRNHEEGYFRRVGLFDAWEQRRLLPSALRSDERDPLWLLRRFFRPDYPLLTALRYLDLKTYLPDDILVKVDRASMACSLEVRPPLLDHRVVEFAFGLDDRILAHEGPTKEVLRRMTDDRVRREVFDRPKRGFSAPIRTWLRTGLATEAMRTVETWTIAEAGLVRPEAVRRFMRDYTFNRWAKLWALMVLEAWHRSTIVQA